MKRFQHLVSIVAVMGLSSSAHAKVLWRSGTSLDQWDEKQSAAPAGKAYCAERLGVSGSPVAGEHKRVLRISLKAGDVAYNPRHFPPVKLGNRSELVHLPYLGEGDERWYRWRVLFPKDFAVTDGKGGGAVFAQWHHWNVTGEPGSPPLLLTADGKEIRAVIVPELNSQDAKTIAKLPQKKGQWRDMILHVVFSSNPSRGVFELWCDGEHITSKHLATLFPGYENYLKMGLYRRPSAQEDNVIYLDEVTEATSRSDVWPTRAGR